MRCRVGIQNPKSKIQNYSCPPLSGQATLELTVAMIGALLFLVAAVKVVLWSTERFITRTQNYDRTRVQAASVQESANADWDNSYEPTKKLEILK